MGFLRDSWLASRIPPEFPSRFWFFLRRLRRNTYILSLKLVCFGTIRPRGGGGPPTVKDNFLRSFRPEKEKDEPTRGCGTSKVNQTGQRFSPFHIWPGSPAQLCGPRFPGVLVPATDFRSSKRFLIKAGLDLAGCFGLLVFVGGGGGPVSAKGFPATTGGVYGGPPGC